MKWWTTQKILALVLIGFAAASLDAQVGSVKSLLSRELPDFPGKEGQIVQVDFAPGEVVPTHHHDADVFVYVMRGSIVTQIKGGKPMTVQAGDTFFEAPDDVHLASRNASRTRSATILVFFLKAKNAPLTILGDREQHH